MAKKRKSVFNTDLTQKDIEKESKEIEKAALGNKQEKRGSRGALKSIYVDQAHHTKAKIRATQQGMKLGEYIEHLIDQDNN